MTIFTFTSACIVPGRKKALFEKLHKRLGTDNMAHVYIMLCILDGCTTRLEISTRRGKEFRDEEYISLEESGFISHAQRTKQQRKYQITELGRTTATKWKEVMESIMDKINQPIPITFQDSDSDN